jgi:hypothetical protein
MLFDMRGFVFFIFCLLCRLMLYSRSVASVCLFFSLQALIAVKLVFMEIRYVENGEFWSSLLFFFLVVESLYLISNV